MPRVCSSCPYRKSLCTLFERGTSLVRHGVSAIVPSSNTVRFDALQVHGMRGTRGRNFVVYGSGSFTSF